MRKILFWVVFLFFCSSAAVTAKTVVIKVFEESEYAKLKNKAISELTVKRAKQFDFAKLEIDAAKLRMLRLSADKILNIDAIKRFSNLAFLTISDSDLSDLTSIGQLRNVQFLSLGNNKITDISALSGLPILNNLFLDWNSISHLNVNLPNLKELSVNSNSIESICALVAPQLERLSAKENRINSISCMDKWNRLRILRLNKNPISILPGSVSLPNLRQLELDWEKITNKEDMAPDIRKFQPDQRSDSLLLPYSLFLLVALIFWFLIRSKVRFDYYLLLLIIPSIISLTVIIALEMSVTYKFELYGIIWFQALMGFIVSVYYYFIKKQKASIIIALPLLILASLFIYWLTGVISSITLL